MHTPPLLTLLLIPSLASAASSHLLDTKTPIHLGSIFNIPSLTLLAWLPFQDTSFCKTATDASKLFSIGGIDALQVHDYFEGQLTGNGEKKTGAWISREGKRFAECVVTPMSVGLGYCRGIQDRTCEGGHTHTGTVERKWSCWIIEGLEEAKEKEELGRSAKIEEMSSPVVGDVLTTGQMEMPSQVTAEAVISEKMGMFTAGVTGS